MITANDTTTQDDGPDDDTMLAFGLAAIELACHAPQGEEPRWTVRDDGGITFVGDAPGPVPEGFYTQRDHQYGVTLREDGYLIFMSCHSEHLDILRLAPAEVAALYRFFSVLAFARLVEITGTRT